MLNEIISQTAVELAVQTRSGSLSAREVVEAHLDRIDEVNGTINAIVAARSRKDVLRPTRYRPANVELSTDSR